MLLISYDITDDRLRTKFSKFIKKYGHRLQYSVYEIDNGKAVLNKITKEIDLRFKKSFSNCDSVMIINTCHACDNKIVKYGYLENEEKELLYFK
ncbi:CRISPR-associated endonuclease Cas2 [Candidatus Dependentiae bacterium]|nr:CRISPR-associated endonuclease Cas2 [Candidatus Dependentiae bacterium]